MFKILKTWDFRIPFLDKPTCLIAATAGVAVENSPGRKCNEQSSVAASYSASAYVEKHTLHRYIHHLKDHWRRLYPSSSPVPAYYGGNGCVPQRNI